MSVMPTGPVCVIEDVKDSIMGGMPVVTVDVTAGPFQSVDPTVVEVALYQPPYNEASPPVYKPAPKVSGTLYRADFTAGEIPPAPYRIRDRAQYDIGMDQFDFFHDAPRNAFP